MALTVQNLRAVGTGVEPASLLPGQIAFNITDKVIYVGDGSNFKTAFDGTQTPGVPGAGWYAMPMDFSSLGDYYVANPGYWGDVPTDQQVLTWSTALNHPIWTSGGGGGGGNQVYVVTNAAVAAAPGATTSAKITAAIGVASPDEGDVTIVTGIPDDVYEGLYFFTTEWVKGAAYAYPSASEVIYDNTVTGLTPTVQGAIDDLDAGLAATTAIANTANSTANSALSIANAALPKAGGTMTGTIVARNINVQSGYSVQFDGGIGGTLNGISDSVSSGSSNVAASSAAVRSAYLLAQAALPKAGGLMTGTITFAAGQTFPISGIDIASTSQLGVVEVGTNIDVTAGGVISVKTATNTDLGLVRTGANIQNVAGQISILDSSTTQKGVVQLVNNTSSPSATDQALTAAMGASLQTQINGITISGTVTLAGSIDASTGLIQSVTTQGAAANFVVGQVLPAAAPDPSPPGNNNYYVIVTNPGTFTPPGGSPVTSENGDWILSDGVSWQELEVGARPAYASTGSAGVIALSDNAQTQSGTSTLLAVTPATLQSKLSDSTSLTSSTTIASSTAVKAAYDIGAAAIPCSVITAVGDIVVGGAGPAPTALPVGTDGQVLVANSACATGLEWVSDTPGDVTSVTGTAPITVDNTDAQNPIVGVDVATNATTGVVSVGSNLTISLAGEINVDTATTTGAGIVQLNDTVISTSTTEAATANALKGVYDIASAAIPCASFTGVGELLAGTGAGTYSALAVGADGQVLLANSLCAEGLEWGNADYVPDACFTAAGDIIVGTGAGTYVALPIGTSGQSLVVDLTCTATGGLKWGQSLVGYTCSATPFNTALGGFAGDSITSGTSNTFLGYNAGTATNIGDQNVAIGAQAALALTTGGNNVAVGFQAMDSLTTGSNNVAVGTLAYNSGNATGVTAVGFCAAASTTTASSTTAVGFCSLRAQTTGLRNTAVGGAAGAAVTTGTDNTFIGYLAGCANTGTGSTIVGSNAGSALTLGGANVLIGAGAGDSITTGFNNTIIGDVSGSTALVGNLILAAGTTIKFQANNSGAWSPDGTNYGTVGQVLTSNGTVAAPTWNTLSLACVPCAAYTAVGDILVGTGTATYSALPLGTSGQVMVVDTACTSGVKWVTATGLNLAGFTCSATPFNTALGSLAGAAFTANSVANTAIGYAALDAETSGDFNVAIGHNALTAQNGATGNVAVGANAGAAVTSGSSNTVVGQSAGAGITSGTNNTFIGSCAGDLLTNGNFNTALGSAALGAQTAGDNNTAIGQSAGTAVTTGQDNTFVGQSAGSNVTTGSGITAIGYLAGRNAAAGTTAVGCRSLQIATGANNTAIGWNTGACITTGACNTVVGYCALDAATSGNDNVAIGFAALTAVTTGNTNTAVGSLAAQSLTTGLDNVAVGYGALVNSGTASCNVAIGRSTLTVAAGGGNTAVGHRAGLNVSSGSVTAIGSNALTSVTTGTANTAVGFSAGCSYSGSRSVFIGHGAGDAATTGNSHVFIGADAGGAVTLGIRNILIGDTAGDAITTGSNNTIIGDIAGSAALADNLILAAGNTIKLQVNENGAVGVGSTPSYGTSGQILSSTGTAGAAAWTSSLPQVTAPTASTDGGVEGQIASDSSYFYMYTGGRWQRIAWDTTSW